VITGENAPEITSAPDAAAARPPVRRCQECGAALPPPRPTGRPRLFCAEACRRAGDARRRRIGLRLDALHAWRALLKEPDYGGFRRSRVRREIRELVAEVYCLEHGRRRSCPTN
jgi:hypothetical protein